MGVLTKPPMVQTQAQGSVFGELSQERTATAESVLAELIRDNDIQLKTELKNPVVISQMQVLAYWLESEDMEDVGELVMAFREDYMRGMVSHDRKGRKEVVQALSDINKKKEGFWGRMFGPKDTMGTPPNQGAMR